MKIFISWSGERSEALAKALREWFPLVLHFVEPWLSQSDIKVGDRWSIEIAKELENCNFGVICITKENVAAPWILFEAGALAKSMQDGRVIPLLLDLDLKELSGPLAQFQAKKADVAGIKDLIVGLNKSSPNPVPDTQLEKLYQALWDDLEKQLAAIPKSAAVVKATRPQGDILEELVSSVRNVEMRFRDSSEESLRSRRRRSKHYPDMVFEMLHSQKLSRHNALRYVLVFSSFKDDFPWLFELAMEAYRAQIGGNKQKLLLARKTLGDAVRLMRRGPFFEMMMSDDKSSFMLMRELEEFIHNDFDTEEDLLGEIETKDPEKIKK
jgi:TIR domain